MLFTEENYTSHVVLFFNFVKVTTTSLIINFHIAHSKVCWGQKIKGFGTLPSIGNIVTKLLLVRKQCRVMLQHVYLAAAMYIYVLEDMLCKLCSSVLILFANSKKELYPLHSNWLQKWNTFPACMQQPQWWIWSSLLPKWKCGHLIYSQKKV